MKRTWSSKKVLERFDVCRLLFREKIEPASGVATKSVAAKRPMYRYIFTCPGQAQALVSLSLLSSGTSYVAHVGQIGQTDHDLDPKLLLWDVVQDLNSPDAARETCPGSCRFLHLPPCAMS